MIYACCTHVVVPCSDQPAKETSVLFLFFGSVTIVVTEGELETS